MSDAKERVKKSLSDLKEAGGRVLSVRLTPAANSAVTRMMSEHPEMSLTKSVNTMLESFHREKQDKK